MMKGILDDKHYKLIDKVCITAILICLVGLIIGIIGGAASGWK